jgi:hypothetical protein
MAGHHRVAPAVVTTLTMPLTYSIANGIGLGFITYVLAKILAGRYQDINLPVIALAAVEWSMIFSQNRFPLFRIMVELFVEHDLFRKPVPTFRDHALSACMMETKSRQASRFCNGCRSR